MSTLQAVQSIIVWATGSCVWGEIINKDLFVPIRDNFNFMYQC